MRNISRVTRYTITVIAFLALVALTPPLSAQWTQSGATVFANRGVTSVGIGTNTPAPYGLLILQTGNAFLGVKLSSGLAGFIMDRGSSSAGASVNFRTAGVENFIAGMGVYTLGAISRSATRWPPSSLSSAVTVISESVTWRPKKSWM